MIENTVYVVYFVLIIALYKRYENSIMELISLIKGLMVKWNQFK